ncbi:putative helicase [Tetrabaena socialis]|uniref:Putative helicase n=1 Tax=Tetrabaena socialis TaxID=47790 RepID=A0A2J7ZMP8_9CHLO|nr:putative helicase [Tetrabaena socialis]|eukprot:PNH01530.1 putative helicase [Tetrabaena socialis]
MNSVALLSAWLRLDFPKDLLMPVVAGTKVPLHCHKDGAWSWDLFDKHMSAGDDVGILLRSLCVADFDDVPTALAFEEVFPELLEAPMEQTKKGRHYFFHRPDFCDAEGYFDGARQVSGVNVDFKSVCTSGTSGLICVCPSTGKVWVRPPWDHAPKDISRELLDRICKPRNKVQKQVDVLQNQVQPQIEPQLQPQLEPQIEDKKDVLYIRNLVGCLLPATSVNRAEWVKVGHILKREGAEHFQLWNDFSATAGPPLYKGVADCQKTWDSFQVDNPVANQITIASLCFMAERDAPGAYQAAQAAHRDRVVANCVIDDHRRRDMWNVLRARFPADLGGMAEDTFRLLRADGAGSMAFADSSSGLAGTISSDFIVHISDRFSGLLFEDVLVKGPLSNLHSNIPCEADFVLNRPDPDRATLRSVTPNIDAVLTQYRIGEDDSFFKVDVPGKRSTSIATRPKMDLLNKCVLSALSEHAAGTSLAWFVTVNNINNLVVVNDTSDRVRPDYDFLPILRGGPGLSFTKRVVAISEQEYYVLDPSTCVWMKGTLGNAAGCLRAMAAAGDLEVEGDEVKYLKRYDGANRVVKSFINELQDRTFASKLDSLTPKGCVAMDDGMFDAGADSFRPFVSEDLVSRTIGYAFQPADAIPLEATRLITSFYEQVLPCEQEREYFVRMMAASLFGSGRTRYFLILTDERDGSNGKTTLMRAVKDVFGRLAAATQRSFLNISTSNDPNQHAANLLAYKGARLAFFDEPDKDAKLDIRRIKDLSSGASRQSGRACGGKEVEEFTWKALIVLACNEANFPVMDMSDQPFLKRMKPLRMRSLFVAPSDLPSFEDEPFIFPTLGEDYLDTIKGCSSAHLHLLAQAYRRYVDEGGLGLEPPSVQESLKVVMQNADPRIPTVLDYLEENVDFAPRRTDADKGRKCYAWLTEKQLVNHYWQANSYRLKSEKKSDYTLVLRRAMELKGRKLLRLQPTCKESGKIVNVQGYDRVKFID